MKKILVIHPSDPSTDFLREIYADLNCTIVRQPPKTKVMLKKMMADADLILFLGHGTAHGLLNVGWPYKIFGSYIVNSSDVPHIQNKNNIYIWCHADKFVEFNNLTGFSSGMFISETSEAMFYGMKVPRTQVEVSNYAFAVSLGRILSRYLKSGGEFQNIYNRIREVYNDTSDSIITFNNERMRMFE